MMGIYGNEKNANFRYRSLAYLVDEYEPLII